MMKEDSIRFRSTQGETKPKRLPALNHEKPEGQRKLGQQAPEAESKTSFSHVDFGAYPKKMEK